MLTDTHCHLDMPVFADDRAGVLDRARAEGVARLLVPGIDLASSEAAVALADAHSNVYAAVGVHPHSAESFDDTVLAKLAALARHPRVVAIGEIGLDYYRNYAPEAAQKRAFGEQLGLAAELGLPVIVHCREAHADTRAIVAAWLAGAPQRAAPHGVFHSFGGTLVDAHATLALGFMIGITGPVTFKKADELRQIAVAVPDDRLLVETDAPYLAPEPKRGRRNEPAYVRWIVSRIASERGVSYDTLAAQTTRNAAALFGWAPASE